MIKIQIFLDGDGMISGYRVRGHSGTDDSGHDVVCAGVSALAQSAMLGIGRHLGRDGDFRIDPSGEILVRLKERPDAMTEAVFQTARIGFFEIARTNPKVVRIKELRER